MLQIDLNNLGGQILLATPSMRQSIFKDAVIFLCSHSEDGAMGIIINKPLQALSFSSICKDLKIEAQASLDLPILFGGPVEKNRGVVLHSQDYKTEAETIKCTSTLSMTASFSILSDLAKGLGPSNRRSNPSNAAMQPSSFLNYYDPLKPGKYRPRPDPSQIWHKGW